MVGSNMATVRNAPKPPYSSSGMALARKCTAHIKTPPAMFASMSQPLWRKNDARCAVGVKGRFSTFSASMGLGWRKGAWGSRKRLEEAQQQVFAALKGKEGNPLVAGVGLGNVARAEDDARDAALRQDGGITEIMCAS